MQYVFEKRGNIGGLRIIHSAGDKWDEIYHDAAANALTYVAGQRGRNRMIVEKYVGNHRYVSKPSEFIPHIFPQSVLYSYYTIHPFVFIRLRLALIIS